MKIRIETACCFVIIAIVIVIELVVGKGTFEKATEISSSYEQAVEQQLYGIFDEQVPLSEVPVE